MTADTIQSIAQQLRRTRISAARARDLASTVEKVNDVAIAASLESDFNDEPSCFASTLRRLKAPR